MAKCTQCGDVADLKISWLAKESININKNQSCNICSSCMALLWSKYSHTQFGQTVSIRQLSH